MKKRHLFAAVLLVLFAACGAARAAEPQGVETRIVSDAMRLSPGGGTVVFEGAVFVQRPDFKIWADRITVTFGQSGARAKTDAAALDPDRIETIVAVGKVKLEREGRVGHCGKVTYLVKEGLFRMEDKPVLQDGKNRIQGEIIKLYVKDNRSEVVGSKTRRVEALFFTPQGLPQQ